MVIGSRECETNNKVVYIASKPIRSKAIDQKRKVAGPFAKVMTTDGSIKIYQILNERRGEKEGEG